MKQLALVAFLLAAAFAQIQTSRADKPKTLSASPAQQLIDIDKQWGEAIAKGDVQLLDRILADEFIGAGSRGEIITKPQQMEQAKNGPVVIKDSQYEADEYVVRLLDKSVAVMLHRGTYRSKDLYETHRSLHVFVNRQGRWQVIASEQIPIPQN